MFGFGKGLGSSQDRISSKDSRLNSSPSIQPAAPPPLSLEPAIDGPPSPERIRAYTEQMKRSSVFGHRSRSETHSSGTLSFQSADSSNASGDRVPSRKSSIRSNSSSMVPRAERPESMHLFTKTIFSRSRKSSLKGFSNSSRTSTMPTALDGIDEVSSARDRYYGKSKSSRKGSRVHGDEPDSPPKASISVPYNFQHVMHTHKEHLPNLGRADRTELASEFSALRASQMPTHGELKGIRAEQLHFENFSSEALVEFSESRKSSTDEWSRPKTSPNQSRPPQSRNFLRKSSAALHMPPPLPPLKILKPSHSHESIVLRRRTPPPRPPRSPLSPECPVALPPRISSRTASVGYFDAFQAPEIPHQRRGVSSRASSPAPLQLWEQAGQFANRDLPARPVVTPLTEEAAWPLTGTSENFGGELADVPEEEDNGARLRKGSNSRRPEIRWSRSFPDFYPAMPTTSIPRYESISEQPERPGTGLSDTLGVSISTSVGQSSFGTSPQRRFSRVLKASHDDWEDDIDYCYEHEAEADCSFEWTIDENENENAYPQQPSDLFKQPSDLFSGEPTLGGDYYANSPSPKSAGPPVPEKDDHFKEKDSEFYHPDSNRFRGSLLVPSPLDLPELSPMSMNSIEPEVQTPSNAGHLHPRASFASSFKESHGFTLSPSLLIPGDFASQMEQDQLYEQLLGGTDASALDARSDPYIFNPGGASGNRESVIMEGSSTRSSYRSSGFSRGSTSFRSSTLSKNNSQESVNLLSRISTASYGGSSGNRHSSVPSTGSLPELIVSSRRQENDDVRGKEVMVMEPTVQLKQLPTTNGTEKERDRINDLLRERELHLMTDTPTTPDSSENPNNTLSPVAESFVESTNSMDRVSDSERDQPINGLTPAPRNDIITRASFSSTSNLQSHGRKISAPILSATRPSMGTRHRSASSALAQGVKTPRRGSYVLFPHSSSSSNQS